MFFTPYVVITYAYICILVGRTKPLLNILFSLNCEVFYTVIPHKSFNSYTVKYGIIPKIPNILACELKIKTQDPVKSFQLLLEQVLGQSCENRKPSAKNSHGLQEWNRQNRRVVQHSLPNDIAHSNHCIFWKQMHWNNETFFLYIYILKNRNYDSCEHFLCWKEKWWGGFWSCAFLRRAKESPGPCSPESWSSQASVAWGSSQPGTLQGDLGGGHLVVLPHSASHVCVIPGTMAPQVSQPCGNLHPMLLDPSESQSYGGSVLSSFQSAFAPLTS